MGLIGLITAALGFAGMRSFCRACWARWVFCLSRSCFTAALARWLVALSWSSRSCWGVLGFSISHIRMHLFMATDK